MFEQCAAIKTTCKGFNSFVVSDTLASPTNILLGLDVSGQNFPESGIVSFHIHGSGKQTRIYGGYPFGKSLLCGLIVIREIDVKFLYFLIILEKLSETCQLARLGCWINARLVIKVKE